LLLCSRSFALLPFELIFTRAIDHPLSMAFPYGFFAHTALAKLIAPQDC